MSRHRTCLLIVCVEPSSHSDEQKKLAKRTNAISLNISTQNHRRIPGFAVVVVTIVDEILNDFHMFSECVFFPEENQQPMKERDTEAQEQQEPQEQEETDPSHTPAPKAHDTEQGTRFPGFSTPFSQPPMLCPAHERPMRATADQRTTLLRFSVSLAFAAPLLRSLQCEVAISRGHSAQV